MTPDENNGLSAATLRQKMLEQAEALETGTLATHVVVANLRRLGGPPITHVTVELYKPSGTYYTEEQWAIPEVAIGPYSMAHSPDFRRIDGGPVVVPAQEPWGYPHMFPGRG
jgi:hypothetical protein